MIVTATASNATGESKALGNEKLRAELPAPQRRTHGYIISLSIFFLGKLKLWIIFNVIDWTGYESE